VNNFGVSMCQVCGKSKGNMQDHTRCSKILQKRMAETNKKRYPSRNKFNNEGQLGFASYLDKNAANGVDE